MKDFLRKHAVIITFGAAGLILLILVFFTNLLVNFSIKTLDYNIERRLIAVSKTAAALVTAEELETYREPADMEKPEYKALRQKLSDFSKEAEVLYVYYLREIDGNLHYIIDNDFDPETQVGLASEPQEISLTPGAVEALAGESVCAGLGSYTVGWDGLIYSLSPVYDAEGNVRALCGVDIMDKQIINMHKMYKVLFGIEIIAVIAVFASGLFTILKYRHEADRANKESESKTVFLAHTSHEIRTPMNAIIGMGELAAREYGSPKGLEYIGDIQQAGKNLLAIINDILDFSKIEAGNLQINSAPYDTASVFNDVLNIIRLRMDSKPIELKTDISPDIPAVMIGDETRIRQILLNLLNNAVKYTPKGFINFSATGKFISRNTIRLTFTVKDSGIGIKQDDIPKLFGNFARMEARRNKNIEGAGLGLAITKRLCQAMSGDVFVESKYGKGSVFTAQIVQTYIEKVGLGEIKKHEIKSEKKKTPLFKAPKAKILIVDDIAANLKVAEGLLTPYKAWIDTCTNAKEAIRLIEKNRYDLIFMDHMMPEMDGVEATDIIRREQDGYFKSVPIIALTANAVTGMKEMFLEKGFTDFLSKPIEIPKLYAIMNKWIPQDKQEEPINTDITGKDKKPKTNIFEIEGVDVNRGLALIGDINVYLEVLKLFCEDAKKRLETLKAPPENNEESIRNFVLHTHSLKSAAGSIGAMQTAEEAAKLEAAGKSADFEIINTNLNSFTEHLADVINKIEQAIS